MAASKKPLNQPPHGPKFQAANNHCVPEFNSLLEKCLDEGHGETAVADCRPRRMSSAVTWTVAAASDSRAVHRTGGAEGLYFDVAGSGW